MDFDADLGECLKATKRRLISTGGDPLEHNKKEIVYANDGYKPVIKSLIPGENWTRAERITREQREQAEREQQERAAQGYPPKGYRPMGPTALEIRNQQVMVPAWTRSRQGLGADTHKTLSLMRKTAGLTESQREGKTGHTSASGH